MDIKVITIDGPSGTGKGTLCAKLAAHLGWHMLDSGAIYRLLALRILKEKGDERDIPMITNAAQTLRFRFTPEGGVWLGATQARSASHEKSTAKQTTPQPPYYGHLLPVSGEKGDMKESYLEEEVSQLIRDESCGQLASKISVYPEVRQALLARQRAFLEAPGLVTDGRDMGTVVFPDAQLKFYLMASADMRAQRRYLQLKAQGICANLAQVATELAARDERDSSRAHAPLMPAKDAIVIDTTHLQVSEVFQKMLVIVNEKGILG